MSTAMMWQTIALLLALKTAAIFYVFYLTVGLEIKDELQCDEDIQDD